MSARFAPHRSPRARARVRWELASVTRAAALGRFAIGLGLLAAPLGLLGLPGCGSSDESAPEPGLADTPDAGPTGPIDASADDAASTGACKPLAFPSGVTLATVPDPDLTAQYADIAEAPDYPLPECFIDTEALVDAVTGKAYDLDVNVGTYFTLRELVGTELTYSKRVLLSPELVRKLDVYRDQLATSVSVSSGYRSPAHQRAVCRDMCGADSCSGTCAARSRHSWGDAMDHGVYPTKKYSDAGCAAQFNYVYREGDHVHLDLNPEHAICTVDIL